MEKNMNFFSVKTWIPTEIIEFMAYFLLILTNCVDFNVELRNVAKF